MEFLKRGHQKTNHKIIIMRNYIKIIVLSSVLAIPGLTGAAAEAEKNLKTKPDKVTVYLQGAQVYRSSVVNLSAGQNTIIFEGLENVIDQRSIQAGGNGNFIISDVQYITYYPELEKMKTNSDAKYTRLIRQLNDSIVLIDYETEDLQNKRDVLTTEKNVLLNYNLYKGQAKKDSLAFLKDGLNYLREKMNNIYAELLKIKKDEAKLAEKKERINTRLEEINNNAGLQLNAVTTGKPDHRVVVSVISDAATQATININYYVSNAGWTPIYDLRTEGVESPVKLTYKAMVRQFSGADWKDVKLTLSTGNPNQNFTLPELNTWYMNDYTRNNKDKKNEEPVLATSPAMTICSGTTATGSATFSWNGEEAKQSYSYAVMDDNTVQAEFEIKLPYTIPTDNKNHMVAVLNKELETKYIYKAIPKLDMNAYLTARITGWEDLNLLPGQANVFFDGTYVGQSYINTSTVGDTLELSMGQDKSVALKRSKLKDKIKEKVLDNDKLYTYAYEIVVKNGNAKGIEIEVMDQLPLSNSKQIVITKENVSGASYDENTGKLTWRNTIKSKDNKKYAFSYTVKAPKDMPLAIR
jgi:uncharacterized protein (TIGR02231 family)